MPGPQNFSHKPVSRFRDGAEDDPVCQLTNQAKQQVWSGEYAAAVEILRKNLFTTRLVNAEPDVLIKKLQALWNAVEFDFRHRPKFGPGRMWRERMEKRVRGGARLVRRICRIENGRIAEQQLEELQARLSGKSRRVT
jgi:hypothetical protein